jgi:hypothetical protein
MVSNIPLMISACAIVGAYVCRLDALSVVKHRVSYILLHVTHAMAAGYIGLRAATDIVDPDSWLVLSVSLTWLIASYGRWKGGPPAEAMK